MPSALHSRAPFPVRAVVNHNDFPRAGLPESLVRLVEERLTVAPPG